MITVRQAVHAYAQELASLGKSANTIRVYTLYLHKLAMACGNCPVDAISPGHVTAFFGSLPSQPVRNLALPAVRGFMAWAVRVGYLSDSAARAAVGPRTAKRTGRRPKHYIPVDQFGAALASAGDTHPLDRAVIALALYTLCRQSELSALQLKHVDLAGRSLTVWRQKRQRWTQVVIPPDLYRELANWLMWLANHTGCEGVTGMLREHPDWHVIPHHRRGQAVTIDPGRSATRLEFVVKRVLDGLGVASENGRSVRHLGEGMHAIRRSGARALLDHLEGVAGKDRALNMVTKALDHDDPSQTLRYIDMDVDKQRLDNYLRTNPMYGTQAQDHSASVINLRSPATGAPGEAPRLASGN